MLLTDVTRVLCSLRITELNSGVFMYDFAAAAVFSGSSLGYDVIIRFHHDSSSLYRALLCGLPFLFLFLWRRSVNQKRRDTQLNA